jgi:hypothetical protein
MEKSKAEFSQSKQASLCHLEPNKKEHRMGEQEQIIGRECSLICCRLNGHTKSQN